MKELGGGNWKGTFWSSKLNLTDLSAKKITERKSLGFLKLGTTLLLKVQNISIFSSSLFFVFCHFSFDFSWLMQIFWSCSREAMIPTL